MIIASVDRDGQATAVIQEAARIGKAFDKPVHVVHVLTRDEFVDLQQTSVKDTGKAVPVERIEKVATEFAADAIEDAGIEAEAVGLVGAPDDEIVNYANKQNADYIVIGGRKQSPVGKALFGSVSQSILLDARQPVVALTRSSD